MSGIQVGSSFSPLALTASSLEEVNLYYPDITEVHKFSGGTIGDTPVTMPCYFLLDWNSSDAIVKSFNFRTTADSRIRIRLYYTEETNLQKAIKGITDDSLVYESLPDTEYKNPEDKNYGGVFIKAGDSETDVRNEMYLTYGKKYVLEFDSCVENFFLGNGSIPFFSINWWAERNDRVVLLQELLTRMEDRLKQDIALDNGMWFLNKGADKDGRKGENRNVGGIYGDEMCIGDVAEQSVLQSIATPMMRIGADERVNIASEEYVNINSVPKVFHASELKEGQTGLVIQTLPPTYLKYDPKSFPTYNTLPFLMSTSFIFMPDLRSDMQILFKESGHRTVMIFTANENIVLHGGFYIGADWVEFAIDTNSKEEPPEGYTYPIKPYIPSEDRDAEEAKKWFFEISINTDGLVVRLVDPNRGEWTCIIPKATHIGANGVYTYGMDGKRVLQRLWNVKWTAWDSLEEPRTVEDHDETVIGLQAARMVTKYRRNAIDILDPIAIHKYADLTKDFHTFFEPKTSGVYRCFDMEDNLPEGYTSGDNDFYCFVYAVSTSYKTIEALDIRSGRRFTKSMLGDVWNQWFEWGINQGGQVPILVYSVPYGVSGSPKPIDIASLPDTTIDDVFWVTCGSRGQAIQVTDPTKLKDYSASFYVDKDTNQIVYFMETQGMDTKNVAIYKFVRTPVKPPGNASPYVKLTEVLEDLNNGTQSGDRFNIIIEGKCLELMRNLSIAITTSGRWETTPVIFDGKAKYYFEFPWQPNGNWKEGYEVSYQLEWQDQNGRTFKGFERVVKPIIA